MYYLNRLYTYAIVRNDRRCGLTAMTLQPCLWLGRENNNMSRSKSVSTRRVAVSRIQKRSSYLDFNYSFLILFDIKNIVEIIAMTYSGGGGWGYILPLTFLVDLQKKLISYKKCFRVISSLLKTFYKLLAKSYCKMCIYNITPIESFWARH